jgi:hypothetical protein
MRRNERRDADRIPVGIYLSQIVGDEAHRSFTTDISPTGLYMERICTPLERKTGVVQLEIPLPGISDSLWAKAEIVYDCFDALFHGTAVRFVAMAGLHRRLLEGWLHEMGRGSHQDSGVRVGGVSIFRPAPLRVAVPFRV